MITLILSLILFIIFLTLGSFHIYWLFGGTWGLEKVIPSKENQAKTLQIPKLATLFVGLILVLFGLIYLMKSGYISIQIPNWITDYGYWFVPSVFFLRAIGDFNYVGFFKKVKNTKFAKADSKLFSPLCLGIGIIGILIQLIEK